MGVEVGLGYSGSLETVTAALPLYGVLGPFTPGDRVTRITGVAGHIGVGSYVELSFGIAGASSANAAGLFASGPVITASNSRFINAGLVRAGPLSMRLRSLTAVMVPFELAVGILVVAGSEWLIWGITGDDLDGGVAGVVSAHVERVGRRRLEPPVPFVGVDRQT